MILERKRKNCYEMKLINPGKLHSGTYLELLKNRCLRICTIMPAVIRISVRKSKDLGRTLEGYQFFKSHSPPKHDLQQCIYIARILSRMMKHRIEDLLLFLLVTLTKQKL